MKIRIETCTTSIATSLNTVRKLREDGIPKEHIYIVTNIASKDTILNNYDLRNEDGSIFSSHSLIENVKDILTVPEFKKTGHPLDTLQKYQERIEFGSIIVAVVE
ncbi:hypothetical protein [Jeotgalibaca sp. A122]|uniref:hypothetical protein n=1 Tax=Jeotgalibaca sp. A122 TaxID=3457322 RepID=UPI003FCFEF41